MIYACSDIHGRYDKYRQLLNRLDLGPDDRLFIIGDMIDRGPDGIRVLLDGAARPNVTMLAGNHEMMALIALRWLSTEIDDEALADEGQLRSHFSEVTDWLRNGGQTTLEEFKALTPEEREHVITIMNDLEVFAEVDAGDNKFVLVHASLGEDTRGKTDPTTCDIDDMLWTRPDLDLLDDDGPFVVVGHTPTIFFRAEEAGVARSLTAPGMFPDTIFRKNRLIAIDCHCYFSDLLGCLCLDTLEEIYV